MPRSKQILSGGIRLSDCMSLSVLAEIIPLETVKQILTRNQKATIRERKLPREFLVYYIIALAWFSGTNIRSVLRLLLDGLNLLFPFVNEKSTERVAGEAAISQAREKLGHQVMKDLFACICKPVSSKKTRGAWYKKWRLVSIDGSNFDLPDEEELYQDFPKHNNGAEHPYPQLRFSALVELGSRCIFAAAQGNQLTSEKKLSEQLFPSLTSEMLLIADRYYLGYDTFQKLSITGTFVLLRAKRNFTLPCLTELPDGSYLSELAPPCDKRHLTERIPVRVIEFRLVANGKKSIESYRLVTNIMDCEQAPAQDLAGLYSRRWGIETAFAEIKRSLKIDGMSFRSKRAELVKQEFWGFLLAHYVLRCIMWRAAEKNDIDPGDIGFTDTVNVVRRKIGRHFSPHEKADDALHARNH